MEIKLLLTAIKNISERLKRLEKIGIPKDGKTPIKGIDYFDGKDGKDFSFDMFTKEQLLCLKGKDGRDGRDGKNGKDGKNGIDGKDGKNGKDGEPGKNGLDGKNGEKGERGENGKDGKDGRGVEDIYIKGNHLYVVYTDGTEKDAGELKKGRDGIGAPGPQGIPGKNGVGVLSVKIVNGHLITILQDGTEIDAGELPVISVESSDLMKNYNSGIRFNEGFTFN